LIALGAKLHLRHGETERSLPLEDFFIAYGKQNRVAGELVWGVSVPKLVKNEVFRAYKITKRFDQDISALLFALKIKRDGNRIVSARLAMGGMAATPKRATKTELILQRIDLQNEATWTSALTAITQDYQPINDMRASANYRIETAKALLHKALIEISEGENTRVIGTRGAAA
jgi:xanthine dehydrogenase small subunit